MPTTDTDHHPTPTRRRTRIAVLACLAAAATALAPAPTTHTADADPDDPATYGADHLVVAGAADPEAVDGAGRFEYLAYYPDVLRVHRGDVVQFRLDQFHTVTFSDPTAPRRGLYRTDETGLVQTDGALPSHDECGTAAELPPCVYDDPAEYVNSGWNLGSDTALTGTLRMQFDVPEGVYTYYCTVHAGMQGSVAVVPDDEPVPTPDEVLADRYARIAADTAAGEALLADPPPTRAPDLVDGRRRHHVQVGATTADQRVAALRYFPSVLAIEAGDLVEFTVPAAGAPVGGRIEAAFEGHTVAFEPDAVRDHTVERALERDPISPFIRYLLGMCDPDDVDGGAPGYVQPASFLVGCPDSSHTIEIAWQPSAFRRPNGIAWDDVPPGTYYDSGLMGPADTPCRLNCDPYADEPRSMITDRVTARFPAAGEFGYRCFLHGAMDGNITVRG